VTNLAVDAWLPVPEAALDRRPEVEAMTLGCLDAPDLAVASRDTAVSRTHTAGNGSLGQMGHLLAHLLGAQARRTYVLLFLIFKIISVVISQTRMAHILLLLFKKNFFTSFLVISVRPIISTSTGPIFTKFARLVEEL